MITKPKQFKHLIEPDNEDLLIAVEGAMDSVAIAMEALRGYEMTAEWFDTLSDLWDEMRPIQEQCEAAATEDYRAEMDGLERQYRKDVM